MSIDAILDAARAGMQNERLRMDRVGHNIAIANRPLDPRTLRAQDASFAGSLAKGETAPAATRTVLDPGHPLADGEGYVHYPAVDLAQEMTALLLASRGYEANVRTFNVLRSMVLRAFDIGAK